MTNPQNKSIIVVPLIFWAALLIAILWSYLVYYWYMHRGRWLTSEYRNKIYLGYDSLLSPRADGALIRLVTPVGQDLNSAQERLTAFVRLLVPVLPKFMQS